MVMPDLFHTEFGWYCFSALPKKEHIAAELLRKEAAIETFCPRISYQKQTKRGPVKFVEPLFPGYLFVHTDLRETYRRIRAVAGVRNVVAFGGRVPGVPQAFIDDLRVRMTEENLRELQPPELQLGQRVVITNGPFKDWAAIVSGKVDARQRVALLLDFLGRQMEIRVEQSFVLPEKYEPKEKVWED